MLREVAMSRLEPCSVTGAPPDSGPFGGSHRWVIHPGRLRACVCVCACVVCVCVCVCGCEEVRERRVLGLSVACVRGTCIGCFDTLVANSCLISVPVLTLWKSNIRLIYL